MNVPPVGIPPTIMSCTAEVTWFGITVGDRDIRLGVSVDRDRMGDRRQRAVERDRPGLGDRVEAREPGC